MARSACVCSRRPLTPAVDKPAVRVVERGHRAHAVVAGLGELLASYRLAGEGRDLNAETFWQKQSVTQTPFGSGKSVLRL